MIKFGLILLFIIVCLFSRRASTDYFHEILTVEGIANSIISAQKQNLYKFYY